MAELDVGQHCQVEHCRQRGDRGALSPHPRPRETGAPLWLPGWWRRIFFHLCVVIVQEYFALNTEAGSLMVVLSLSKSFLPVMEYLLVTVISERLKTDQHTSYPCSFKDCAERELVAVICLYCEKNFCLRHRHQSDHECEKLEIPKPRMAATQKLVKDIIDSKTGETASKRRKGAKSSETAAKVALMKLKMHADGDKSLPQMSNLKLSIFESANLTERIYFQVFLPKGSKEKSKPMFFCHRWSIGKAIDFAASLASLKNDNNKLTAKKLRLCHITSGEALPLDHTLETWIAKEDCPLYNGGNIILEYLNDEEQFCKNVESYFE
ncbi:AN1-type zinc finger protein 1 isoform X1 [Sapajus apella]|uniref:AN1-type zinc finger protein 1 isoform X1 n=1 Tax=Sapajus apella TaxID=9515 RepID=A0A6J3FKS3_SAPAP|nr:AN1-type zinc finger protein 1 isoform X1 [Sapajus apella]